MNDDFTPGFPLQHAAKDAALAAEAAHHRGLPTPTHHRAARPLGPGHRRRPRPRRCGLRHHRAAALSPQAQAASGEATVITGIVIADAAADFARLQRQQTWSRLGRRLHLRPASELLAFDQVVGTARPHRPTRARTPHRRNRHDRRKRRPSRRLRPLVPPPPPGRPTTLDRPGPCRPSGRDHPPDRGLPGRPPAFRPRRTPPRLRRPRTRPAIDRRARHRSDNNPPGGTRPPRRGRTRDRSRILVDAPLVAPRWMVPVAAHHVVRGLRIKLPGVRLECPGSPQGGFCRHAHQRQASRRCRSWCGSRSGISSGPAARPRRYPPRSLRTICASAATATSTPATACSSAPSRPSHRPTRRRRDPHRGAHGDAARKVVRSACTMAVSRSGVDATGGR